jgi:hypothetical protein
MEGTLFVIPRRTRIRTEVIPTGSASVAQSMMARSKTAMTLCPWGDRPANEGKSMKRKKRRKATAILKTCFTGLFPSMEEIVCGPL